MKYIDDQNSILCLKNTAKYSISQKFSSLILQQKFRNSSSTIRILLRSCFRISWLKISRPQSIRPFLVLIYLLRGLAILFTVSYGLNNPTVISFIVAINDKNTIMGFTLLECFFTRKFLILETPNYLLSLTSNLHRINLIPNLYRIYKRSLFTKGTSFGLSGYEPYQVASDGLLKQKINCTCFQQLP